MVRLIFLVAVMAYVWLHSLFVTVSHTVTGGHHVFAYNATGLILTTGFNVIPLAVAVYLWRVQKDKTGACIFALMIPACVFLILPQIFLERIEITPTHLIYRREPPHTRYNADVPFAAIRSAVEQSHEQGTTGCLLTLKDGRTLEFPANTVMTAAHDTISAQLRERGIPVVNTTLKANE
ncbi:MAG: hypothetical protein H7145_05165 [Akkermansiaceae bacterium]|nr:hypothetical protein [Armatimonadota bacterium]